LDLTQEAAMATAQVNFSQQTPLAMLTAQFLEWLAARPRSYEDTMEAWRSSCPRLSVWEDALGAGLVALQSGAGRMRESRVILTAAGRAALAAAENVTTSRQRRA
jgi:hypothetical protein